MDAFTNWTMYPIWFWPVIAGIYGAVIGSFLNVVIYRAPQQGPLFGTIRGNSACPNCHHRIRTYDLIPVLSWIALRGKCRDCHTRISPRYPIIETFTAVTFTLITITTGGHPSWWLFTLLTFAACSIALAMIDFDTMTLPNRIVAFTTITTGALLLITGITSENTESLIRAALTGATLLTIYGLLYFLSAGRALGGGDMKLAFITGAITGYLSWGAFALGTWAGWALGAIYAVTIIITRGFTRRQHVPFGPFMLAGTWVAIAFHNPIINWYTNLLH